MSAMVIVPSQTCSISKWWQSTSCASWLAETLSITPFTTVYKKGVANATLYFKSTLEADTPLCVLHAQETGFYFWTLFYVVPWGLFVRRKLFFFLHLPLRLIWGGNPGFPPFSGTNRAHKLEGVCFESRIRWIPLDNSRVLVQIHHFWCRWGSRMTC